jgi:hypothetical protein
MMSGLHYAMFMDCLEHFSTPEQYEKWFKLAQ